MHDLDDRLARYAADLGERVDGMDGFVPPLQGRVFGGDEEDLGTVTSPLSPASRPRWVWLATAAAVCVLALVSAAWWGTSSTDVVDTTDVATSPDSSSVNNSSTTEGTSARMGGPIAPLTWEAVQESGTWASGVMAVAPFAGGLVAVGADDTGQFQTWWSFDGRTWDSAQGTSRGRGVPQAVAANDSVAVAVGKAGDTGSAWVTSDGTTWTMHRIDDVYLLRDVMATADGFVAVGSSPVTVDGSDAGALVPAAWRSDDGRSWSRIRLPVTGTGEATGAATSGSALVIVGAVDDRPMVLLQRDGAWFSVMVDGADADPGVSGAVAAVSWSGTAFIAVGRSGGGPAIWSSVDGASWPSRPTGPISLSPAPVVGLSDVAATERAVAVVPDLGPGYRGREATLWVSLDNSEWEPSTPAVISGVDTWDGRFLAISGGIWLSSETMPG